MGRRYRHIYSKEEVESTCFHQIEKWEEKRIARLVWKDTSTDLRTWYKYEHRCDFPEGALVADYFEKEEDLFWYKSRDMIKHADEPKYMTWYEAIEKFGPNGTDPGWRLPTKDELKMIYGSRDKIGGFKRSDYWSSSDYDCYIALSRSFSNGHIRCNYKCYKLNVRCVRREWKDLRMDNTTIRIGAEDYNSSSYEYRVVLNDLEEDSSTTDMKTGRFNDLSQAKLHAKKLLESCEDGKFTVNVICTPKSIYRDFEPENTNAEMLGKVKTEFEKIVNTPGESVGKAFEKVLYTELIRNYRGEPDELRIILRETNPCVEVRMILCKRKPRTAFLTYSCCNGLFQRVYNDHDKQDALLTFAKKVHGRLLTEKYIYNRAEQLRRKEK
jgi:hypothetical protein